MSVIDTASNTVSATVTVGAGPFEVAVTPPPAGTALSTRSATETRTSGRTLLISGLSATLTGNGRPLSGRTITFTNAAATTTLCTATTNSSGVATCTTTITGTPQQISALADDLSAHGYLATFAGDNTHSGSHATGIITQTPQSSQSPPQSTPPTTTKTHPDTQPRATLPQTGADTAGLALTAIGLLGLGLAALLVGRKPSTQRH